MATTRNGSKKKSHEAGAESSVSSEKSNAVAQQDQAAAEAAVTAPKPKSNFVVRTIWTLIMIASFFATIAAGHLAVIVLVVSLQILTFKEVINVATEPARAKNVPTSRVLNWYFLGTTIYFLEGENVIFYFKHIAIVDTFLIPLAVHHRFLSYCLYILGFVFFVFSLEKNSYRFQFGQFCITHVTLLIVVVQAHFIVQNIFNGLFWFLVPCGLVITNDIFAYLCGITFGRTQLIKISPKKTVEGFVGAWICTVIFGVILTYVFIRFKYFICPMGDPGTNVFSGLDCKPNPVFLPRVFHLPEDLHPYLGISTLVFEPIYIHVMWLATFASLIAPFGGFFASGLKRTFKVKDFGDTIPGHGGITDRMDCQYLMGFFVYMYYESFVSTHHMTVTEILHTILFTLDADEQVKLFHALQKHLETRGLL